MSAGEWGRVGALLLLYLLGSALFSGMETGGYLVNRLQLRTRARRGERSARRLLRALGDAHQFIFTVLIGNNLAIYLLSREVTRLYLKQGGLREGTMLWGFIPWNAEAAATLTLLFPLFLFGELLPKNWFHRHADRLMYRVSWGLLFFERLFVPLTFLLKRLSVVLAGREQGQRIFNEVSLSLQGLQEYFCGERCDGLLSSHQHGMIDHLVSLHRVSVRELMTPLAAAERISLHASIGEVLERMRRRDCEQVLLCGRGARRVVGYLSLFDLMDPSLDPELPCAPFLRPLVEIPAAFSANQALHQLRQNPKTPAIVLDRSARAMGVLQFRDIAIHIVSGS